MRIVLDTASFITALRSSRGAAAEIVRLILLEELILLMDLKLGLEYRDVALRSEHLDASGRSAQNVLELIQSLEAIALPVSVTSQPRPLSSDPNDGLVFDPAINGHADAIVTGNAKHFLAAGRRFGIAVLSPAALLQQIGRGDEDAY